MRPIIRAIDWQPVSVVICDGHEGFAIGQPKPDIAQPTRSASLVGSSKVLQPDLFEAIYGDCVAIVDEIAREAPHRRAL